MVQDQCVPGMDETRRIIPPISYPSTVELSHQMVEGDVKESLPKAAVELEVTEKGSSLHLASEKMDLSSETLIDQARNVDAASEKIIVAKKGLDVDGEGKETIEPKDEKEPKGYENDEEPFDEERDRLLYPEGFRAWLVVLGCFIYAATALAWSLTWGIFASYYYSNEVFPGTSLALYSLIGGIFNYTGATTCFFSGRMGDRFGYKKMIAIGSFLSFLSLLASSFSVNLLQVFVLQGFCLGTAQGIAMPLYMALPSQHFRRNRGLATGIALSGSGIGGGIATLVVRKLIVATGYQRTLFIYSFIHLGLWTGAWFLLIERPRPVRATWLPRGIWKNGAFYSLMGTLFVAVFGFLTPYYYITAYTTVFVPSIDSKSIMLALPLVVMNFSSGCGRIFSGFLSDRIGPLNTLFASFFFGGVAQILVWTFATSYASIIVFSMLYGFTGSWFLPLLPVASAQLFGFDGLATITGFGILINAPGQLAGASIAGLVLQSTGSYKAVSIYSGGVMIAGSLILLYARFSREPRVWAKY